MALIAGKGCEKSNVSYPSMATLTGMNRNLLSAKVEYVNQLDDVCDFFKGSLQLSSSTGDAHINIIVNFWVRSKFLLILFIVFIHAFSFVAKYINLN